MREDKAMARFWAKTQEGQGRNPCLLWVGSVDKDGYGETRLFGMRKAHRAAWVITYGAIPKGTCVLHRCDTPGCVRPHHLFLGTPSENMHDRARKGRYATGDKHHWHARPETVRRGDDHWARKDPARVVRGARHYLFGARKLTRAQAVEIVSRRIGGASQRQLADAFGVAQSQVGRVLRGQYYPEIVCPRLSRSKGAS